MKPQKFKIGDVVRYVGPRDRCKINGIHIIAEVIRIDGKFEYATNIGIRFKADDFVLVRKADEESLKELDKELARGSTVLLRRW